MRDFTDFLLKSVTVFAKQLNPAGLPCASRLRLRCSRTSLCTVKSLHVLRSFSEGGWVYQILALLRAISRGFSYALIRGEKLLFRSENFFHFMRYLDNIPTCQRYSDLRRKVCLLHLGVTVHNTAVCFKWFSFSGRGLTDLLSRRISGDFI